MKKLRSGIRKYEDNGKIEITVKIDGCGEHKRNDVATYIDTGLLHALAKYVRKKEKLEEIISRTKDVFGLLTTIDNDDYGYLASSKSFYKITCWHHGSDNYDVEVTLTRRK